MINSKTMIKQYFAVIRAFEIIGEAAKNIPQRVKGAYPHVKVGVIWLVCVIN